MWILHPTNRRLSGPRPAVVISGLEMDCFCGDVKANPKVGKREGPINSTELRSCRMHVIVVTHDQRFGVLQMCLKGRSLDANFQIIAGRHGFARQVALPCPLPWIRCLNVDEVTISDRIEREEPDVLYFVHARESM